ncbi:efflux RND transporter periplasmic adaptor subunit [Haliangium ochraceum]|uniref:Efflux transporter, RND family, MFP subunit n=1 Tax=Haliangium ochraceum (strain DSM 14365 / JCM 11303 / SMP-2) TaxID=502025 RepID=D0LIT8_HALO1|nr:HlyD family efflux transporter periplasmic adaptor subunit [Haliangium ochraceum]ACY12967.1 efflux transporter, RND family, MFP subunit [Haliangium ochraceum DSM 14365]
MSEPASNAPQPSRSPSGSLDPKERPVAAAAAVRRQRQRRMRTLGRWLKRGVLALVVVGIGASLVTAFLPEPVSVDLVAATRAPMRVVVREDGITRVVERYVISAPLAGELLRIEHEPGDAVAAGDVLARIVPARSPLLDARSRAGADARLGAARAARRQAEARAERALAASESAEREAQRYRDLGARGAVSDEARERTEADARMAAQDLAAARMAVEVATHELEAARAALGQDEGAGTGEVLVRAPVAGRVLLVHQESAARVEPGRALLEIGDPGSLEIVADVLTRDAVAIAPGAEVAVERWGGESALRGRVERVEPSAFTRVSALGVEEQRVYVLIALEPGQDAALALGDGYRVEVAITVWQADDVLSVPLGSVFRDGERWAVYVERDGVAALVPVELGRRNRERAEILSGLDAGARVIAHPGDRVSENVAIVAAAH